MFPIRDHNPSGRTPYVTWALIAVNVAVFLLTWARLGTDWDTAVLFQKWGLLALDVTRRGQYGGVLTSMFLHAGWLHLLGNMLFLWIFGDNLEGVFGPLGFLAFYLLGGAGAAALHVAMDPVSMIPMVGASGAIAAVMGGYLLLFPRAQVDVLVILVIFVRIIAMPAWIVLCLWFVIQILGGLAAPVELGGVAYWAHAGGFLSGLALALPVWLRGGGPAYWSRSGGAPPSPAYAPSRIPLIRRRR
ncbi:MAG: rhomboid family intramembrane serine protease [Gemmobacter sp.]|nr:rhomboid family intramembrane serine protease [Gemmobacter sp.]